MFLRATLVIVGHLRQRKWFWLRSRRGEAA